MSVHLWLLRHAESEANLEPGRIGGRSVTTPLSALGVQQAHALGRRLREEHEHQHAHAHVHGKEQQPARPPRRFDLILVSSALRTRMTAQRVLQELWQATTGSLDWLVLDSGVATGTAATASCAATDSSLACPIAIDDRLLEQDQGDWEGGDRRSIYTFQVLADMTQLHMDYRAPNGESLRDVHARMSSFLHPIVAEWRTRSVALGRPAHVAVFGHGMAIRTMMYDALRCDERIVWRLGCDNTSITELVYDARGVICARLNDAAHVKRMPKAVAVATAAETTQEATARIGTTSAL